MAGWPIIYLEQISLSVLFQPNTTEIPLMHLPFYIRGRQAITRSTKKGSFTMFLCYLSPLAPATKSQRLTRRTTSFLRRRHEETTT
jgi:hypothetical protein